MARIFSVSDIKAPSDLDCFRFLGGGAVVIDSLFIVDPIKCGGFVFGPYFVM